MKNVLFVSIAFPPKLDPECIQTAKYFKYLVKHASFKLDVVTSKLPTLFMPYDPYLEEYATGYRQQVEIKVWENKYSNFLIRLLSPALLLKPDSKSRFYRQWSSVPKRLKNEPSIIYSRSFPLSSAMMALKLKRHYKVPWVMHLSDPWVDSPYFSADDKVKEENTAMEAECFEEADSICFTSPKTIDLYREKYPHYAKKYRLFPNVYDPDSICMEKISFHGKLRFVYTGGLAGIRTAEPLLKAIRELRSNRALDLDKMEFIFAGDIDRANKKLMMEYSDPSIQHIGAVSYQKAIELQRSAHILMLFEAPIQDAKKAVFFPSKLLDYAVAQHPIMAVTSEGSTTSEFINSNALGSCFDHAATDQIILFLERALEHYEQGNDSFFFRQINVQEHDANLNAKRLITLFHELCENS